MTVTLPFLLMRQKLKTSFALPQSQSTVHEVAELKSSRGVGVLRNALRRGWSCVEDEDPEAQRR